MFHSLVERVSGSEVPVVTQQISYQLIRCSSERRVKPRSGDTLVIADRVPQLKAITCCFGRPIYLFLRKLLIRATILVRHQR